MTYQDRIHSMFDWQIDGPLYSSLLVIAILIIICFFVFFRFRRAYKREEYKKRPKGLVFAVEQYYGFANGFVRENMGEGFNYFTVYFMALFAYLFLSFIWGITGMPSIIDWMAAPLALAIIMFVIIHITAIRYQRWRYFSRYVEPVPFFLPINLVTMWTPIISTTMRMFGNCLSGSIILGLIQWALSSLSGKLFGALTAAAQLNYFPSWDISQSTVWTQVFLAPIPMGILHLYFSLFTAGIQTLVFASLNALWFAAERPESYQPKERVGKPRRKEA